MARHGRTSYIHVWRDVREWTRRRNDRPPPNRIELDSWHSHLLFVFIFVFFVVGSGIRVMLNMAIDNEPCQHFVLQA